MKISIKTLGCRANRYESDRLQEKFAGKAEFVKGDEIADICIVNTCTVTAIADRKSRLAINALRNISPNAKVVVFGCGSRINPEMYLKLGIDLVANDPTQVDEYLSQMSDNSPACDNPISTRTRAVIKVQDGCNNFCTYCIIAHARGREESYPMDRVMKEVCDKESQGFKEIILTGINIGSWRENNMDLADLIQKILDQTDIPRVRLSSIEPQNFSEKFLSLLNHPRFCNHLHMSLQSGSDATLTRMKRGYDTSLYANVCDKIYSLAPDTAITTDIIVGFPGETAQDHNDSMNFAGKIKFAKIHVFPYSKRAKTPAFYMPDQVSLPTKKSRADEFRELADRLGEKFLASQVGKTHDVLFEETRNGKDFFGWTQNYIHVRQKGDSLTNRILPVTIKAPSSS